MVRVATSRVWVVTLTASHGGCIVGNDTVFVAAATGGDSGLPLRFRGRFGVVPSILFGPSVLFGLALASLLFVQIAEPKTGHLFRMVGWVRPRVDFTDGLAPKVGVGIYCGLLRELLLVYELVLYWLSICRDTSFAL